jgi:hypothetical protein
MSKLERARYSPVYRQAEITGKGQPDLHSFMQRKQNMGDHVRMAKSYHGGDQDQNLFIRKGELLVGEKNNRSTSETCFSSYNGLYYGDKSIEALMRMYNFKGVATGDWDLNGEPMFGTDPLDHGFGFLRAGSDTIVNNSEEDLFGGDLVAWQFGDVDGSGSRGGGGGEPRRLVDNGLNPWASQNKEGTPLGKALIQIKRFDPMDFKYQVAGAFSLFNKPKVQGGIRDVTLRDFLATEKEKELSSLQEEAFAMRQGFAHVIAIGMLTLGVAGGQTFEQLVKTISENDEVYQRILDRNLPNNRAAIEANRNAGIENARYTIDILYGGIFNAAYSKMSRIVGKVMRSSKAGTSVDIMFSHFKCWI